MKLFFKKWDFWYWLVIIGIFLGSICYINYIEKGSLGGGILLILLGIVILQMAIIYIAAKLGELVVRLIFSKK